MDITHKLQIKASADKIFEAVSTEKGIKGWWSVDCTVGTSEGDISRLKFNKEGTLIEMGFKTITLVKDKKVVWECIEMPNPAWIGTRIITNISNSDNGCKVEFSHNGFDEKWKGQEPFEQTMQTWNHFVNSLVAYCEENKGQPW